MTTLEDLMAELESARSYQKSWRTICRRARWLLRLPRTARVELFCARQRLTRGWDQRALWSLDRHLTKTLGAQLVAMARIAHGWPGNYEGGFDAWVAGLRKHGEALSAYAAIDNFHPPEVRADAKAALHWVAEHLGALWD